MAASGVKESGRLGPFQYEDLLNMPDDGRRYEVIEGELAVSPSPKWWHQRLVVRMIAFLARAEAAGFGQAGTAPMDVVLAEHSVVQPDAFFIARPHLGIAAEDHVRGAPDLVIEVVSPSSRRRDVITKRRIYERFGVRHYWIVDPDEETVRALTWKDGAYTEPVTLRAGDALTCPLFPGIAQPVSDLFARA